MNRFIQRASARILNRIAPCLAALAAVVLLAPAVADATPINYDFTVTTPTQAGGPLGGLSVGGTFAYDSSSIPSILSNGGCSGTTGLLTKFDFTWNGQNYDAANANTGFICLLSNALSHTVELESIAFGNYCSPGSCEVVGNQDEWSASWSIFDYSQFIYAVSNESTPYTNGLVTISLAPTAVPEPAALGMFGGGLLLLGAFVGLRRRDADTRHMRPHRY